MKDAAAALGVSVSGVRRGLKSGRYVGHKRATTQGHVWLIEVPDDQAVTARPPGTRVSGGRATTRVPDHPDAGPGVPQEPPGGALVADRARDMATYTEQLLAPWRTLVQQQAEEIGSLRVMLAAAVNGQAQTRSAPPAESQTGRSWWRRLFG